jgi:hypothetical protein
MEETPTIANPESEGHQRFVMLQSREGYAQQAPLTEKSEEVVILPSPDGGFMKVREAVKTVEFGGEEVELRKLTPEEKARRRLFRTIFMAIFGLAFLTAMAILLLMLS